MKIFGSFFKIVGGVVVTVLVLVTISILVVLYLPNELKKLAEGTVLEQYLPPLLPKPRVTRSAIWLDQNWSSQDRFWFHHASQGTATFPVPYDWFVALEQPDLSLSVGLLKDTNYLVRFGFVPSPRTLSSNPEALAQYGFLNDQATPPPVSVLPRSPAGNPDGLPVGFARTAGSVDPETHLPQPDQVGLTCAACHTGHVEYKGVSLRFDGGPAMIDLEKLTQAVGTSIAYTLLMPWRLDAFDNRVLGDQSADPAKREKLNAKLAATFEGLKNQAEIHKALASQLAKRVGTKGDTEEGLGRLDALNRIGNQVFYTDQTDDKGKAYQSNIALQSAPVSFPPIWTVPWFSWAQYDASIGQPLVRNAGEALGVSAIINLRAPDNKFDPLFKSSVALNNLDVIEGLLKGKSPFSATAPTFQGLLAPKWPAKYFPDDQNWQLDHKKVANGRVLYKELCVECHLGPVNDPEFDKAYPDLSFWTSKRWQPEAGSDAKILQLAQFVAPSIGTDPEQSKVLQTRQVEVPGSFHLDPIKDLKERWGCGNVDTQASTKLPFSLALMIVVDRTNQRWFDDNSISLDDQKKIIDDRRNCPNSVQGYKARPLDGVWATAPYLHNGSVPSLWWLLKPGNQRPKSFCTGARDYDPVHVGYDASDSGMQACEDGETRFSSASPDGYILGNSTLGHSFEGDGPSPAKPGVIGRELDDTERYDLIEYLKTL